MTPLSATHPSAAYSFYAITHANRNFHDLHQLERFYQSEDGSANLVKRNLPALIATGQAYAFVVRFNQWLVGSIASIACGAADELGSTLIAKEHRKKGLDRTLRDLHKWHASGERPQIMFERFPDELRDKMIEKRTTEGWSVLPETDPLYIHAESGKPKSDNPNAKTGFVRATSGTVLAFPIEHDPRRNRPAESRSIALTV